MNSANPWGHRVSVVIPTYNRAHVILRALGSVASQTVPVSEIIVVDDGSTDETADVVLNAAEQDARIVYVNQSNCGAPAARNRGIGLAKGDLIAFQDSDDEWDPRFIEKLVSLHDCPDVVAFSGLAKVYGDGRTESIFIEEIRDVWDRLSRGSCISTQTALIDARLLRSVRFDESLPRLQDWDFWLSLPRRTRFRHVPEALAVLHEQPDSISRGTSNFYVALRKIISKHLYFLARHPVSLIRLLGSAWFGEWRAAGVRPRTSRSAE